MSGGHYEYKYLTISDLSEQVKQEAETIQVWNFRNHQDETEDRPEEEARDRLAIAEVLAKVAQAAKLLEWYDSGDTSDWESVKKAFAAIAEK
jgi:hypothetical protein